MAYNIWYGFMRKDKWGPLLIDTGEIDDTDYTMWDGLMCGPVFWNLLSTSIPFNIMDL